MNDAWTDRLSEYADGSLTSEERALLEAHLGTCAPCASTLAGLRAVIERARTLPDRAPEVDLWPGIEARIALHARERSFPGERRGMLLSWPQLVAAGLALVALSGGVSWFAARNTGAPTVATRAARGGDAAVDGPTRPAASSGEAATPADGALAGELDQLEKVLASKRSQLDPETVKTIETNLKIIDLATAQAQQALADDPANPYLQEHLSKTMKRKVEMLRQATVLASAQ